MVPVSNGPHNIITFPHLGDRRNEVRTVKAAKLIQQLSLVKSGLDAGMSPAEIREHEINQCEARIKAEAKRRISFTGSAATTALFLRTLAADLENE
jgi:hypothetical protein